MLSLLSIIVTTIKIIFCLGYGKIKSLLRYGARWQTRIPVSWKDGEFKCTHNQAGLLLGHFFDPLVVDVLLRDGGERFKPSPLPNDIYIMDCTCHISLYEEYNCPGEVHFKKIGRQRNMDNRDFLFIHNEINKSCTISSASSLDWILSNANL